MLSEHTLSSQEKRNLMLSVLLEKKCCVPPIWLMRQAGRYLDEYKEKRNKEKNFLSFCYNSQLASEVTLQPLDRFNLDAAIIFSDILVIPDALGLEVNFIEKIGPVLTGLEKQQIKSLHFDQDKLIPVYKAIEKVRKKLTNEKTLIGFAGGAWTLATYMVEGKSSRDFLKTKEWSYKDSDSFQIFIDILTEAISKHLIEQAKAGAQVLQIFDSWAGVLPKESFYKWVIMPTSKIVNHVKNYYPDVPIIGFPRGAGVLYKDYAEHSGVDALSVDQCTPMEWVVDNINIPVQGNLDPMLLMLNKEKAISESQKILQICKDIPFVFNLGHGVLPQTPVENVEELVNFVNDYVYE